jgi:acetoacetyl-CoA synthetase
MAHEGELLWSPGEERVRSSNLARYQKWLEEKRGLRFDDYGELWKWSVSDLPGFWSSIWEHFGVRSSTPYESVLDVRAPHDVRWFPGARVNYAEHLLVYEEKAGADEVVFHHASELRPLATMTWRELGRQVRIVATALREMGVRPGDRVAAYLPNLTEAAVAMMAATSIGAVWSSAAPEFGVKTVIERFAQIEPVVLFAADGYRFGGKDIERADEVRRIASALPSVKRVVWVPYLHADGAAPELPGLVTWPGLLARPDVPRERFQFERVEAQHPLWVVFSSGTTGLPKAITHSHAGILAEHLKVTHLHCDLGPGSVMFFYTTTGWMMWNALLASLLTGASAVLYDGSPAHPSPDFLWKLAADARVTFFGASPTYVQMMEKAGLTPGKLHDLSALRSVLVSGAPSTPETFEWFYRAVKSDLWVTSQSGGTELCSGFVGAAPGLPVYAGEIQARMLGMDVHAFDEQGREVVDEVGELVVTSPFPSMPIYFWNDEGARRYRESYFEVFPGIWRHGDFIRINRRGGCYIYGRSDSTLNRYGVRIGSAEIYRAVENVPEIADSLIVCCERPGARFFMPLFVKLRPGAVLDDALRGRINARLREDCSPRHVPDVIHQVAAVPYTLTSKKMEVPIRKILMGWVVEKAASRDAMQNPECLEWYLEFAQKQQIWL